MTAASTSGLDKTELVYYITSTVALLEIDEQSPVPLNDQIKAGLRGLVARGLLKPGDQAPSVRALAGDLKVNPNTVARAFRELVFEGFFETRRGDGSYVSETAPKQARGALGAAQARLADAVRLARREGLDWKDVQRAVERAREEER